MRRIIPALLLLASTTALAATPFAIESSPGEGIPVFTATQSFEVPLYASFSVGAETAGVCQVSDGSKVEYTTSVVANLVPTVLTLKEAKTTDIISYGPTELLTQTHYYDGGQSAELNLTPGSTVELLAYRAEGACLFRSNNDVFQAGCTAFSETSVALKTEWWLQARCEGATGWVKVADITAFTTETREF